MMTLISFSMYIIVLLSALRSWIMWTDGSLASFTVALTTVLMAILLSPSLTLSMGPSMGRSPEAEKTSTSTFHVCLTDPNSPPISLAMARKASKVFRPYLQKCTMRMIPMVTMFSKNQAQLRVMLYWGCFLVRVCYRSIPLPSPRDTPASEGGRANSGKVPLFLNASSSNTILRCISRFMNLLDETMLSRWTRIPLADTHFEDMLRDGEALMDCYRAHVNVLPVSVQLIFNLLHTIKAKLANIVSFTMWFDVYLQWIVRCTWCVWMK